MKRYVYCALDRIGEFSDGKDCTRAVQCVNALEKFNPEQIERAIKALKLIPDLFEPVTPIQHQFFGVLEHILERIDRK